MTKSFSLLQTINEKELEIRDRIEQAQQRAETLVQAAREAAEQTVARADQAAQTEAELLYRHEIKKAKEEAEALVIAAREQSAGLNIQVKTRLDYAARQVMELVLPVTLSCIEQPQEETRNIVR